jgi:aubergine-like protein
MGRKLGEEKIFLGKGGSVMAGPRADWSRAATGRNAMLHCVELRNWCVVCTQRNAGITADAVVTLVRCAKEMGMTIAEPPIFKLQTDRTEEYVRVLREKVSEDTQLVAMIMPTSRDDRYNAVKKLLCCERPVPSQVTQASLRQY